MKLPLTEATMATATRDGSPGASSSGDQPLVVSFCGELHYVPLEGTWSFGRAADLIVDDNPYLHRQLGQIQFRQGLWWLDNLGTKISLDVKDQTSRSQATVAPGRSMVLTMPRAVVQFRAGRSSYEIDLEVTDPVGPWRAPSVDDDGPRTASTANTSSTASTSSTARAAARGDTAPEPAIAGEADSSSSLTEALVGENHTISVAELALTDDQRRLIIVLAEATLRSPGAEISLPTNRQAAARLGWTITRFNRKLDNVCERLTKSGVSGLRGQVGTMAADRRRRLVEHSVESGLVTLDDVGLLG